MSIYIFFLQYLTASAHQTHAAFDKPEDVDKSYLFVLERLNLFGGNYLLFLVALKGWTSWESKTGSASVHVS